MKLRIKGNSVRWRVSRSELAKLERGDVIEDTVHFSPRPEARLTYRLQPARQPEPVRVEWASQTLTVVLSEQQIRSWSKETEIGIYDSIDLGMHGSLQVAIEKDFACIDRTDEENADTFANPHTAGACK